MGWEIGAGLKATATAVSVVKPVFNWLRGRTVARQLHADMRQVLGIGPRSDSAFRVGMLHPTLIRGKVHPDDQQAFMAVAGPTLAAGLAAGWLVTETLACDPSENIVLVGSAGPEGLSRLVFGYESLGENEGLRYLGDTLDLPYHWQEERGLVLADCMRYQPNGERTVRPNWPIIRNDRGHLRSIYPETDNESFLQSDLLLVSRLPNFMTLAGQMGGRSIVSIGGSHGVATRSVALLLRDSGVIDETMRRYNEGNSNHFQALYEARSIVHSPKGGSVAKRLVLRDFVPLSFSDDELADARSHLAARYTDWVAESNVDQWDPRVDPQ